MPTSAASSRKLNPPKPPSCMRRSAASMIAVLTSLMGHSYDYLLIDSPCVQKRQLVSLYPSIEEVGGRQASPRQAGGETRASGRSCQSEETAMFSVIFEVHPRPER